MSGSHSPGRADADPKARSRLTLYQSVLGPDFAALPLALRCFHGQLDGAAASGALQVKRGRGLLARIGGWFIDAPPAGDAVPVELRVEVHGAHEVWTRHFAGRPMITKQWQRGAELVESVGVSRLHFELRGDSAGIVFVQRRCALLGVPLPRLLAPRIVVQIRASSRADAWELLVNVSAPVVGMIVEYSGTMIATA